MPRSYGSKGPIAKKLFFCPESQDFIEFRESSSYAYSEVEMQPSLSLRSLVEKKMKIKTNRENCHILMTVSEKTVDLNVKRKLDNW